MSFFNTFANVCGRFFLEREIFTHFIRLFICVFVLAAWLFGGFVMFVGAFLEQGVVTHLFCLLICVRLIINVHDYFTAVMVCHEPSLIVAVCANLATRLGSSRSANFFRGRCTLPEVHFRYPFSWHGFRWDCRQWFVMGCNYPTRSHDPSRSMTPFATCYRSGVLDTSDFPRIRKQTSIKSIKKLPP